MAGRSGTVCEVTDTAPAPTDKYAEALEQLLKQRAPQSRRAAFEDVLRTITRQAS